MSEVRTVERNMIPHRGNATGLQKADAVKGADADQCKRTLTQSIPAGEITSNIAKPFRSFFG